jgi:hypothetical protein
MLQVNEFVNLNDKIEDKIAQIEQKNRRFFTEKERRIAYEMFLSGFFFSQQWNGNEFTIK